MPGSLIDAATITLFSLLVLFTVILFESSLLT